MIQCTRALLKNSISARQSRVHTCTDKRTHVRACTHTHTHARAPTYTPMYLYVCTYSRDLIYDMSGKQTVLYNQLTKTCNGGCSQIKQELPTMVTKRLYSFHISIMLFFNPCYIYVYSYFVSYNKKLEKKLKSEFQRTRHSASPFFCQHCV